MSKNVFADLGLPDADERLLKASLASQINDIIDSRKLKQKETAKILGVDQPKVSAIRNGRLRGFSVTRLYRFLNALGKDVKVVVSDGPESRPAQITVVSVEGRTYIQPDSV